MLCSYTEPTAFFPPRWLGAANAPLQTSHTALSAFAAPTMEHEQAKPPNCHCTPSSVPLPANLPRAQPHQQNKTNESLNAILNTITSFSLLHTCVNATGNRSGLNVG